MTEEQRKELVAQAQQLPPRAMEIVQQLKLMVSNGQKLAAEEILTLASFAYREGLDPLNGECWYIKGKGCMVGIKGLRRKATEALGREDVWYPEFRDITKTYDPTDVELLYAYECTIRNTRATARWIHLQDEAKSLNLTGEQTIEVFGHPPVWRGVGVVHKKEYVSPTYPQTTRCKKRAEAAAINAMMGFGYDVMDEDMQVEPSEQIQEEIIDGEITDDKSEEQKESVDKPVKKSWKSVTIHTVLEKHPGMNGPEVANMLNLSAKLMPDTPIENITGWAHIYRDARDNGKMEPAEAAGVADKQVFGA